MKCFSHSEIDAVATCKSCSRGICRDCLAEVGLSCSCRGRCEADVAALNDLLERGRTSYQKTSATYFRAGVFVTLLGGTFILLGLFDVRRSALTPFTYFLLIAGVIFIGWGASHFVSAWRMNQKS